MTTSYPAALDSFTNPTGTDELDDEIGTRTHSEFHADTNDAIEAIQAELGTDPKGAAASVKARIAATETVANAALPTATAATTYQPLDTDLTAIAALTSAADKVPYSTGAQTWALTDFTAAGRALVDDADASAQRTTLGLVIGTNVQAQDAELSAIAGLTSAADALPYFTGSGTAAVTTLTAAARTVLDDTTVGAMLTTMGGAPADSPTFTGIVTIPAGTAAAPALTWTGDTNTGLYSDTADTIRFSTGGTLRMSIGATGIIGQVHTSDLATGTTAAGYGSSGANLTAVGYGALSGNTGAYSVGVGYGILANNTGTGSNGVGFQALSGNTGDHSNAIGYAALSGNTGAYSNAIGYAALTNNTGQFAVAIGHGTGYGNTYSTVVLLGSGAVAAAANEMVIGHASWPVYRWIPGHDPNTYLAWAGDDTATFVTGGTTRVKFDAAGITMSDAHNIVLNATTGTKIGTATTQKLGFYNATPVVQQTNVTNPTGGATVDAEARTAIDAILSRLETLGLFAA